MIRRRMIRQKADAESEKTQDSDAAAAQKKRR